MQDGGFIKLHRSMLEWEWYKDINTKVVFLHCLLKANWNDGKFQGEDVPRGSFVTSLPKLAEETGLSVQQVRTVINRLKSTGEITDRASRKFRVITIKNYDKYQFDNRQDNRHLTGNQQATNSNIRIKRKEEEKNIPLGASAPGSRAQVKDTFEETLADKNYSDEFKTLILQWLEYRSEMNKPFKTIKGFNSLLDQIDRAKKEYGEKRVADLIRECMARGYQGIIFDMLKTKVKAEKYDINDFMHSDNDKEIKELEQLFLKQAGRKDRNNERKD